MPFSIMTRVKLLFLLIASITIGKSNDNGIRFLSPASQEDVDDPYSEDNTSRIQKSCDNGPNALRNKFGKSIPQTCIDVQYNIFSKMERCYYTYVPESCTKPSSSVSSNLQLPLVFDIHAYSSCPVEAASYTGWMEQAEEECFVLVWPIGNIAEDGWFGNCWNILGGLKDKSDNNYGEVNGKDVTTADCCCIKKPGKKAVKPNDPLFLRNVIDSVVQSFSNGDYTMDDNTNISIDRSRVYMAGHSNGCMASLSMAALYSDVVAAVCCHSGSLLTPFPSKYTDDPVPVWKVHGM